MHPAHFISKERSKLESEGEELRTQAGRGKKKPSSVFFFQFASVRKVLGQLGEILKFLPYISILELVVSYIREHQYS